MHTFRRINWTWYNGAHGIPSLWTFRNVCEWTSIFMDVRVEDWLHHLSLYNSKLDYLHSIILHISNESAILWTFAQSCSICTTLSFKYPTVHILRFYNFFFYLFQICVFTCFFSTFKRVHYLMHHNTQAKILLGNKPDSDSDREDERGTNPLTPSPSFSGSSGHSDVSVLVWACLSELLNMCQSPGGERHNAIIPEKHYPCNTNTAHMCTSRHRGWC